MQTTTAAFEDLVARVRALALEEFREKHLHAYPQPYEIALAQSDLILRLWCRTFVVAVELASAPSLAASPAPADEPWRLPDCGGIYSAIAAVSKPGRANE